jgi:hypothetical protein
MDQSLSCRRITGFLIASLLVACGDASAPSGDVATFDVDPTLRPVEDYVEFIDSPGRRPLGCVVDDSGHQADFIEDEVIVTVEDRSELEAVAHRLNGTILFEADPNETGLLGEPSEVYALLQINAPEASPEELSAFAAGSADGAGHLRFCSQRALNTLAAIARESLEEGTSLSANFVLAQHEMSHRETEEATNTVGGPGIGRGFDSNVFELPYMDRADESSDHWVQDIGAAEAARMVHEVVGEAVGRNRVGLMIIDGGFIPDEFPNAEIIPAGTFRQINRVGACTDGTDCPWHGTDVASAALGRFNDGKGGAGPAGAVVTDSGETTSFVDPIFVQTPRINMFDIIEFIVRRVPETMLQFPDIANISAGTSIPSGFCLLGACNALDTFGRFIRRADILVFTSAGNVNEDVDAERCGAARAVCFESAYHIPCEMPGVVCVGGMFNDRNVRAEFSEDNGSNWGSNQGGDDRGSVDIYAPYGMWLQEVPDRPDPPVMSSSRAEFKSGTSFSSPFVAGVAALVKAASPRLGAREIWRILRETAHTNGPGASVHRWVNALAAVERALGGAVPFVEVERPLDGESFPLSSPVGLRSFADDADGVDTLSVEWHSDIDGLIGDPSWFAVEAGLSEGLHEITCVVSDGTFTVSDSVQITVGNGAPTVSIVSPASGAPLYAGNPIVARADTGDADGNFDVVFWQIINDVGFPTGWTAEGPEVVIPADHLAPGRYTLVATGYDTEGARAQDQRTITVRPALEDNPPTITSLVVTPLGSHELDSEEGLYALPCDVDIDGDGVVSSADQCRRVRFTAYATDDHEPASSLTYVWTIVFANGDVVVNTTSGPRLFYTFPVSYSTVEVVALDSQGVIGSDGEPVGGSLPASVPTVVTELI